MMLTGADIEKEVVRGKIYISDFSYKRLNPNSYNLRLGNKLKVYQQDDIILDPKKDQYPSLKEITINKDGYVLQPNKLYLANTMETTYTENYVPCISGRSSIGRLGLNIHVTAGFGDIGFNGTWTLELFCIQPIKIYPGMEICQIYYFDASDDRSLLYNGKYQNQTSVTESRIHVEME